MNLPTPWSVLAHVRAERCGTRRAVSPGGRARAWPLLLILVVVAGLLAMHTSPFVSGPAVDSPAPVVQVAVQAGPADHDGGLGGCLCVDGCDDMSACPALTVVSWSPADLAVSLVDLAPWSDAPAAADAQPVRRAPARPPIGLRVTAVTVARI
jgi:hypothetical protein